VNELKYFKPHKTRPRRIITLTKEVEVIFTDASLPQKPLNLFRDSSPSDKRINRSSTDDAFAHSVDSPSFVVADRVSSSKKRYLFLQFVFV
jgi:hypothetical protein